MQIKGRVHSIETFGTVDGPGIRFVVFMQGCPLRCIYCHNRDTRDLCGGREATVNEIMEEMDKYIDFIRFSKGGITVTGGEPLLQAEFVGEVFKRCKQEGIHTALDTSGFAEVENVQELLDYTDLVLLDIKHAVNKKHIEITGAGNGKIRSFALYLSEKGIPVWIRYVLVPGYTDGEDDLKAASEFIRGLSNVEKIEVLPYHTMGAYKWEKSGEKYPLKGVREPTPQEVEKARSVLRGVYQNEVKK